MAWIRRVVLPGYWICRFGVTHKGACTCPNRDYRWRWA